MNEDNMRIQLFFYALYCMGIGVFIPDISKAVSNITSISLHYCMLFVFLFFAFVFSYRRKSHPDEHK